jgi:hypothetical protein
MPQPTQSDLHINAFLTNLSLKYMQAKDNFVADQVFPVVPVLKQSDIYPIYQPGDFNRGVLIPRAAGARVKNIGYRVDNTPTYFCPVYAIGHQIPDQVRSNADFPFNLDADATDLLTMQYLVAREVLWATAFFGSGLWTNDWTGVAASPTYTEGSATNQVLQWTDPNSQPIIDVRNLKRSVELQSGGFRPNTATLSRYVFDILCDHPDFVDRVKYGQTGPNPAKVAREAMAELWELDKVLVMDGIQNQGVEEAGLDSGGSSAGPLVSNAWIAGKGILLTYSPKTLGLNTPGCGATFSWTGYYGANGLGTRMRDYYVNETASTNVELEASFVFKVLMKQMGGFISSVVA